MSRRMPPRGEYPVWESLDWHDLSACSRVDPALFYTLKDTYGIRAQDTQVKAAKAICAGCPVIERCLEWALKEDDRWAILGGTTPTERAHMAGRVKVW